MQIISISEVDWVRNSVVDLMKTAPQTRAVLINVVNASFVTIIIVTVDVPSERLVFLP